ncbi:tryptophan--tRNA ligase [Haloarcula hispanica]|uniref:tryptophan--tRNA ligase n=1 Tax=Haloarcula hispanica TaxID=51589 RepID=A0A482T7C9_HALHI|nr:tryptophan--tRNA ligase [Haloarcula hispanica]MCJ0620604.1 tryptophan--tRNA ligase [Haloarcula hispanica]RYJ10980.1 tryptophan--tRNA ligase [Haloarcula hispanica]
MTTDDSHHDDASPDEDRRQSGGEWRESDARSGGESVLPDGGTEAEGADEATLDPWGSSTIADYRKLFEQFGIEEFDEVLPEVPNPHYLMRRGVIFGHRDYRPVAEAMRNDDPFAALSGFMPTGDPHIGHKLVFDEIIWHQQQGGDAHALIADLEAHSARGLSWDEIDEHATDYVLSLLALGFDPDEGTLYRQSDNREVQDLFEADAVERTLLRQAYDAREEYAEDVDRPRCGEAADWLRDHQPAPADARESVVAKLAEAGKEPLRPRIRFLDRNATEAAFEALIEAIDGEKRVYDEHIDTFDLDHAEAEELARQVELDNGGYGFQPPSSIYHRFMTGLTGGKMSSSIPASHISLLDDPEDGYDKVKSATTGGRSTAEEQREKGGKADECPVYELYAYLLSGDDDEFAKEVYDECVGGERLCGGCKEQAAELMAEFLEDHQEKRAEWEDRLDELDIDLDSDRAPTTAD